VVHARVSLQYLTNYGTKIIDVSQLGGAKTRRAAQREACNPAWDAVVPLRRALFAEMEEAGLEWS
jgi:hypothetical protein